MPIRDGWIIEREAKPSLNRHYLPTGQGHWPGLDCWCHPKLEGNTDRYPTGTLVIHQEGETP